jgi:hypothetical protein
MFGLKRMNLGPKPNSPFYTVAAWYSLVASILTPVLAFVILAVSGRFDLPLIVAFCILISSFLLGIAGCRKPNVLVSLIGIVISALLGFATLVYLGSLKGWHG